MKLIFYFLIFAVVLLTVPAIAGAVPGCTGTLCIDKTDPVPVPTNSQFACSGIGGIIRNLLGACGPAGATTASELILGVINILLAIVGLLAVLFVIIGGIRYITAHGNEEQAEGAKKTILHAVIGVVLVILSFAIITIIANILIYNE